MAAYPSSPTFQSHTQAPPREPAFLSEARRRSAPTEMVFSPMGGPLEGSAPPPPPLMAAPFEEEVATVKPIVEAAPPAPAPAPPAPVMEARSEEFAERVAAAVGALRLTAERLAEQARSDALEVALLVARRIVETELATSLEPLFGIVRQVVRRAGESRRVVVRLCPDDAARVEAAGGTKALPGISVASIEILPDPGLEVGDCVVEADFGVVDGRLTSRMEELRRLLTEVAAAESLR